jgi:hypothetical protein
MRAYYDALEDLNAIDSADSDNAPRTSTMLTRDEIETPDPTVADPYPAATDNISGDIYNADTVYDFGTASPADDSIAPGLEDGVLAENFWIEGTSSPDAIAGSNDYGDWIDGKEGDDLLLGLGGDDRLVGGAGNDHLAGGAGADVLIGDVDDDNLWGGEDADHLWGGAGNDALNGEAGSDRLYGGAGHDTLSGGEGSDVFVADGSEFRIDAKGKNHIPWLVGQKDTIADFQAGPGGDVLDLHDALTAANHLVVDSAAKSGRVLPKIDFSGISVANAEALGYFYMTQMGTEGSSDFRTVVYVDALGGDHGYAGTKVAVAELLGVNMYSLTLDNFMV